MNDPANAICKATLMADPEWIGLNAYEMTKRCCGELTKQGQRLPSWMVIRDIIGKGSANDINRGKDDFRREHGDTLRKMSGFVKGVPEALAPHILGFWSAAITLVREEFDAQVEDWQAQIERAGAAVAQAEEARDQATSRAETLLAQITGLQEVNTTLQGRVETEQAARQQAERMSEANRLEIAGQRDSLRDALAKSQEGFSAAISRLQGVERHSLMEIERARTEAQNKITNIEAKAKRESSDYTLEIARVSNQLSELRARVTESEQRTAVLDRDNEGLRDRVKRAETQADKLAEENSRLGAALKKPVAGPLRPLRGGSRKLTKLR